MIEERIFVVEMILFHVRVWSNFENLLCCQCTIFDYSELWMWKVRICARNKSIARVVDTYWTIILSTYLQEVELKVCNGIFYLPSATKLKNLAYCVGHIAAIQQQNVRTCAEKMKVCFVQFTFHVMTISFLCLRNHLQIMFKNLSRLAGVFQALPSWSA